MASTKSTSAKPAESKKTEQSVDNATKVTVSDIDVHQYIPVINGFHGILVYQSKKTGEKFIWNEFGDEQAIELQELKYAKSSAKKFFENNYFMFSDDYKWVIDYLGIKNFYKIGLDADNYDDIFNMPVDKLEKMIHGMSQGQKSSMVYRAHKMIDDGLLDSNKTIAMLEKCLDVELVER